MRLRDLAGQRFGCLVAIAIRGTDAQGRKKWLCRCDCGRRKIIRSRNLVSGQVISCGCQQHANPARPYAGVTGARHPRWKGGRRLFDGYVRINTGPYENEFEHRVVAEKLLGRKLKPNEVVHHRNGVRTDNRPANLQVMTRSEHAREHKFGERGPGRKHK